MFGEAGVRKALLQSGLGLVLVVAEIEVNQTVGGLSDQGIAIAAFTVVPGQFPRITIGLMAVWACRRILWLCVFLAHGVHPVLDCLCDGLRVVFLHIVEPASAIGNIQIGDQKEEDDVPALPSTVGLILKPPPKLKL